MCSETLAYKNSDAGELPRRKHTTLRTRRKFEIKSTKVVPVKDLKAYTEVVGRHKFLMEGEQPPESSLDAYFLT